MALDAGEDAKVAFMRSALEAGDPLAYKPQLHADVAQALEWRKGKTAAEAIREREEVVCHCERMAKTFVSSGAVSRWSESADPKVRALFTIYSLL